MTGAVGGVVSAPAADAAVPVNRVDTIATAATIAVRTGRECIMDSSLCRLYRAAVTWWNATVDLGPAVARLGCRRSRRRVDRDAHGRAIRFCQSALDLTGDCAPTSRLAISDQGPSPGSRRLRCAGRLYHHAAVAGH